MELDFHLAVGCQIWVLGTKRGPLEEQQTLLTGESSLQPERDLMTKTVCEGKAFVCTSKGHSP